MARGLTEINELRREINKLKHDKMRLDWIQDNISNMEFLVPHSPLHWNRWGGDKGHDLRQAIDEEMERELTDTFGKDN